MTVRKSQEDPSSKKQIKVMSQQRTAAAVTVTVIIFARNPDQSSMAVLGHGHAQSGLVHLCTTDADSDNKLGRRRSGVLRFRGCSKQTGGFKQRLQNPLHVWRRILSCSAKLHVHNFQMHVGRLHDETRKIPRGNFCRWLGIDVYCGPLGSTSSTVAVYILLVVCF